MVGTSNVDSHNATGYVSLESLPKPAADGHGWVRHLLKGMLLGTAAGLGARGFSRENEMAKAVRLVTGESLLRKRDDDTHSMLSKTTPSLSMLCRLQAALIRGFPSQNNKLGENHGPQTLLSK